jgi:hypothetical protein
MPTCQHGSYVVSTAIGGAAALFVGRRFLRPFVMGMVEKGGYGAQVAAMDGAVAKDGFVWLPLFFSTLCDHLTGLTTRPSSDEHVHVLPQLNMRTCVLS